MTKQDLLNNGFAQMFQNNESTAISFLDFAKDRQLTGKWNALKEPLYTKMHSQGELAGQKEPVMGVRFETSKSFILMGLSRNAAKIGLTELLKQPGNLQVRIDEYNGYENYVLCTGRSDREVGDEGGSFSF